MNLIDLAAVTTFLPRVIAAVVILIVGWIVAAIVAAIVRGVLRRTGIDRRIAASMGGGATPLGVENGLSRAVYYLILLFVVIAALQALSLTIVTEPLSGFLAVVLLYLPRLAGAAVLALVAWIVATILRTVVGRVLAGMRLDERLSGSERSAQVPGRRPGDTAGATGGAAQPTPGATSATSPAAAAGPQPGRASLSQSLAEVVYWLVWLLFLPAILNALGLEGILQPVQVMLNRALGFLPNLVAAAVILIVGWFVARLVQRIVTGLLASVGVDALGERVGLGTALGGQRLSGLLGLVVYVLIFIPVLVAALNALALDAVTGPISNMLNQLLAAVPNIFAATLILVVAFVVGRMVAGLVASLLAGLGFDTLPARLGLASRAAAPGATAVTGGRSPSQLVGTLVLVGILLFAALEAAQYLGFALLADLLAQFLIFAGHILVGLAVFAIAAYLANLAAEVVRASGATQSNLLALAARVAILVLGGAMALRQMGLANEIINLAFGLMLGAVALAAGLAFGLGGREVAGEELRDWRNSVRSGEADRAVTADDATPTARPTRRALPTTPRAAPTPPVGPA